MKLDDTVRLGDRVLISYRAPVAPAKIRAASVSDPREVFRLEKEAREKYDEELKLHQKLNGLLWYVVRIETGQAEVAATLESQAERLPVEESWIVAKEHERL
jgi:hypothetical protein